MEHNLAKSIKINPATALPGIHATGTLHVPPKCTEDSHSSVI